MVEKRNCWLDPMKSCKCEEDNHCIEMYFRYAKVVYCNDKNCLFNQPVPFSYVPNRGLTYKPFEDDKITGICARDDIALTPHQIAELKVKRHLTTCAVRSDRSLERPHFPDPDKIQGGSLPDPHSADWSTSSFGAR